MHYLIEDCGLRLVLDLRTAVEVQREGPTPLREQPLVRSRHLSLLPEAGDTTDIAEQGLLPWNGDPRRRSRGRAGPGAVAAVYTDYLRDRPEHVVAALHAIRDQVDGASLVHCAAGKDRTGVVVALTLSVAGVHRDEIVADYAATGDVLPALVARLMASPTYAADLAGRPLDSHRPRAETMQLFLAGLDREFGGPLDWLSRNGFEKADQAALRDRLLA